MANIIIEKISTFIGHAQGSSLTSTNELSQKITNFIKNGLNLKVKDKT